MKAAIFDFDGTLVDSMPLHFRAYQDVFAAVGLDLSRDDFFQNIGGTAKETIPRFLRGRPCALSVEEIHGQKKQRLHELLDLENVMPLEIAKLVVPLRSHCKTAIASSGSRPGIEKMLTRLSWQNWFDVVVTGEDVALGKPAPDLFLCAAQRLQVNPAECVVFEDADDGVEAARRAGMHVLDVRKMTSRSSYLDQK